MFGIFKSPSYSDPRLGVLERSRGLWRGSITTGPGADVPLMLAGPRSEPDAAALQAARLVLPNLPRWRDDMQAALFEHYLPYAETSEALERMDSGAPFPMLEEPSAVWPYVRLVFVSVLPMRGVLTVEFGYAVAWDDEHTLGARFQGGRFEELCGSVTVP